MRIRTLLPVLALTFPGIAQAQDWIIPAGQTVEYDTINGRVLIDRLRVEAGATLRILGPLPFGLTARKSIVIEGELDLSGFNAPGVLTLNTTNQPEIGAPGVAGGGTGGTGSWLTTQSTPSGLAGFGSMGTLSGGGGGGETGYGVPFKNDRRGAGGGGGALAADAPVHPDVNHPSNRGLIAEDGENGTPTGLGAISQTVLPIGGQHGAPVFVDGQTNNDFFGVKLDPVFGPIQGELSRPVAGQGGGAGGDSVKSSSFPLMPFTSIGDEKGAGGGGGGGLGLLVTRRFTIGAAGSIRADGGDGGGGENTLFFDRVGGGSGAGSGGYLVLQAVSFDLSQASDAALQAIGGVGGNGRDNTLDSEGAGGNGGPGVIQLHTPGGLDSAISLPPGKTLDDLSTPNAHVLMPVF